MLNKTSQPPRRLLCSLVSLALTGAAICLALTLDGLAAAAYCSQQKKSDQDKPGQEDSVRLHSDLVVVTVTVTDKGGLYAHGLTAKEFSVSEDGAQQSVHSFSAEESPFAAAILIDMSGSMEYKFGLVRGAAAAFVERIRDDDQVTVYGFNNKVHQFQDYSNSRDISDYVWDAKAENITRLYDCMDDAITTLGGRVEKRRAILLISDGWDSGSRASFDSVMKRAFEAGITIYALDLTDDGMLIGSASYVRPLRQGRREMQEMAGQSGGRYVHSPQGDKLEEAFTGIVDELRNQYTLTYYSTNEKRDGRWRKLNVNLSRPGLIARARRGYFAPRK